ncbi:MAG TPA: DALR anticodon-binding domain-containing protein, partial [Gammaproteobacteria bacterium]|nr:DALR anticodon-binding domain-containing protein [Gammaproteobacteria bacterium]
VRVDVVEAVLALDLPGLLDSDARIQALSAFVDQPAAQALAAANKRCANILRQAEGEIGAELDAARFRHKAEAGLHNAIEAKREAVAENVARADYTAALAELAELREPVDRFFDDVLVMDEDPTIRGNRLALLTSLHGLFLQTADWARIQVE